jgi:hypothetical protein
MAVAAPLLVGCNDSSPTEPKLGAGPWTGTYNGVSPYQCDSSAQLNFGPWVVNRGLTGTITAPCFGSLNFFDGDLQGNTFTANILDADLAPNPLKGTLSGSSLEITMFNELGSPTGQLHLHR